MKKIVFLLLFPAFLATGTAAAADSPEEKNQVKEIASQVVRIRGYEGVSPRNIFIEPGTVVIWLNQYKGDIRVVFPEKKVSMACKSPVNFSQNDEGYFTAEAIGFGSVASLCFVERGTFSYYIERSPTSLTAKSEGFKFEGKIAVK